MVKAAATANAAVIESTAPGSDNAASCTFAAAVVENGVVVFGNIGDSRVYWIPDHGSGGDPAELSIDDSVAQSAAQRSLTRAPGRYGSGPGRPAVEPVGRDVEHRRSGQRFQRGLGRLSAGHRAGREVLTKPPPSGR
jgi:hypothetical protein